MQTYIKESEFVAGRLNTNPNNPDNILTVRPNIRKVFTKNIILVIIGVIVFIALLIFLNIEVGLDVFLIPFETFGIKINPVSLLLYAIVGLIAFTALMLMFNYIALQGLRYEIYKTKIMVYEPSAFIFIVSKEIPISSIIKISYDYEGFFNKLLVSGEVIIDLSGMRDSNIRFKFIDDIEKTVRYLQGLVNEHSAIKQAQFTENYRIGNIMKKF